MSKKTSSMINSLEELQIMLLRLSQNKSIVKATHMRSVLGRKISQSSALRLNEVEMRLRLKEYKMCTYIHCCPVVECIDISRTIEMLRMKNTSTISLFLIVTFQLSKQ